ncbi:sensor histidine kinase [Nonomuraea basaltis]|uniref:sensor histidine kinase n=1 Tax=Nonomuraea basaltis TaxID=2495887 RepID=UPI0014861CF7|nr:histidine kinase [Nonomuraea basaltis]
MDIVVVVLAGVLSVTDTVTQVPVFPEPYDLFAFCLLVASALSLWFRRRAPVAVAWVEAVLAVTLVAAVWVWPGLAPGTRLEPEITLLPAAVPFASYAVAAFARNRRLIWLPLVVVAAIAFLGAPPSSRAIAVAGMVLILVGGPAALGRYVVARAERAKRDHHLRAEQARRQERLRLAAEIHDVVSHRVSVMVLQAGALQLTAADEMTRQAAGQLRTTGCQTLDELRDLVGLLNAAGPADSASAGPLEPMPDLSALVESAQSIGTIVEVDGAEDPCLLPPVVGRTAYRVVQEALTNVHKHAPGARVRLQVRHLPAGIQVSIHNTAPTRAGDAVLASAGAGVGLLGLRRRIELINGTLHAEPCTDGGYRVEANLPSIVRATGETP